MKKLLGIVIAASLVPAQAASEGAQPPDTTVYVVPSIVVEAKRSDPDAELFNRSGFVASFDLSDRKHRAEDLAAVLSQMVGVKVRQYGGLGDFATVSIRGSSASHVNVFLDGVPMNDAYSGVVNLADLSSAGVQRVEVYRGFSPPQLGAGAIGGAVNLVSSDPSRWGRGETLSGLEFHASYGSYDTSRQQFSVWLRPWKVRVFAHASHWKTLGNFPFVDDNGTPVNTGDDETVDRSNNDSESYGGGARLEADLPGTSRAAVSFDVYNRNQGVAGIGSHQSREASYDRRRGLVHANVETKPFLFDRIVMAGTAFYSESKERFRDPGGTVSLGRQDTDNTVTGWGGRLRTRFLVPLVPLGVDAVLEERTDLFHPVDHVLERDGPERWRRSSALVLSGDLSLLDRTVVLTGTQRWVRHVNEFWDEAPFPWLPPSPRGIARGENRSPSVGLRWNPTETVTVKGNIGRYHRLPTFLELFGNLGTVTGNGDLEPEQGLDRDVGVVMTFRELGRLRRVFLEMVYMDNQTTNLILFFPNSQQTTRPTNIGSARIRGWEFALAATVGAGFRLSGNYSRLDARDTGDIPYYRGNELAGRPRDDAMVAASWQHHRLQLTWEAHYIGANFLDRANMVEVGARNIHNAIVQLSGPVEGVAFSLEARNVWDDRASDVAGYPLPGRSFYTTLSYRR